MRNGIYVDFNSAYYYILFAIISDMVDDVDSKEHIQND